MAYVSPRTWIVGEVVSAPELNEIRDTLLFLHDQGASLTAAAAITPTTQFHKVTGATQINTVAPFAAGARLVLVFTGTPVVSHNNNGGGGTGAILFPDAANHTMRANEVLVLVTDGTSWFAAPPAVLSSLAVGGVLGGTLPNPTMAAGAALANLAANSVTMAKMALKVDSGTGVSFSGSLAVTFATAFTAAPVVVAGVMVGNPAANGGTGEPANYIASVTAVTQTGFTLQNNQGGTRTVPWIAVGA